MSRLLSLLWSVAVSQAFLLFMTRLRNADKVLRKMSFGLSLSEVFLIIRLGLGSEGGNAPEVKCPLSWDVRGSLYPRGTVGVLISTTGRECQVAPLNN